MTFPVQPGDMLLGKYRVERVLGRGGMGVVVAVRHVDLGELFAIKFLLPAALAQPDAVERFLREARASARLKGEHVAKVHDVGRLPDGLPYMVMEHLSGSDLKDVVQQRGPLPVADAVTYVLQACDALAEAHSLGIIHRDLKPANMFLVRRPNGSPCVKVLDFGISKQIEPENVEHQALTRTGMVFGSPLYMSPEQMIRTKEADPRGDIWSMGVVLYQLLTGTLPFLADAVTEVVGKVLQEEPKPPSYHQAHIPPAVDAVVMRCLQKRRELRFQSVEQMMEALRGVLAVRAVAQSAPTSGITPFPQTSPFAPSGESRPSQPSSPAASGTVPFPAAVAQTSVAGPEAPAGPVAAPEARAAHPSTLNMGPIPAAIAGPAAQTGQAWGATGPRQQAGARPVRMGIFIGAALVVLVVVGGSIAALRFAGPSEAATGGTLPVPNPSAATTAPVPGPSAESAGTTEVVRTTDTPSPTVPAISGAPSASHAPSAVSPTAAPAAPPPSGTTAKAPAKPVEPASSSSAPGVAPTAAPIAHPPGGTTGSVTSPPTATSGKKHDGMY